MALTDTQKVTLKAYILAQPDLAPLTSGPGTDYGAIAAALNADASPVVKAWLPVATPDVVDEACNWTAFDAITAGKRDSWLGAFMVRNRDFTRAKVRNWVTDVWGNATAGSNAEAILLAVQENASRAENALGGATRTTGTVSGLARNFVGDVSLSEVSSMFNV
jgi:hypothetical protein